MITETRTVDEVLAYLNELHQADPSVMYHLCHARVRCNEQLADHPTCQVMDDGPITRVGLLGVLNGMFGVNESGYGPIAASFSDDGTELLGFIRTPNTQPPATNP